MGSTCIMLQLLGVLLVVGCTRGAEWKTSGEHHCIERCHAGSRKGLDGVLWCQVVDGITTEYKPEGEEKYMWDYCTPAIVETVGDGHKEGSGVGVGLPERVNRTRRQAGSGGGNFNPGTTSRTAASIHGKYCEGACTMNYGGKYSCDLPGHNPNTFFCSPNEPLKREQLTSHNKLWCINDCIKGPGNDYYECKTLYGYDRCSPQGDRSASGKACHGACQPNYDTNHHHYQCHVDEDKEDREDCGNWYVNTAKKALEYTNDDKVCAGPCQEQDGALVCSYVEWDWEEDEEVSTLQMRLGYCGLGNRLSITWLTISIFIMGVMLF